MAILDLKRQFKALYTPSMDDASIVSVPPLAFLMIDGRGNPNTAPEYVDALGALYAVAYTAKFMLKKGETAIDSPVMPLEGLWWADDMTDFTVGAKDNWQWTMMIMQPEVVTPEIFTAARQEAMAKKRIPALADVRLASFDEGLCAQIMYRGPYADEGPTIARLHAFIAAHGYSRTGKHHEIYLGDPRRTEPERLKTIIRQPIRRA
jgi:hypothetical protein